MTWEVIGRFKDKDLALYEYDRLCKMFPSETYTLDVDDGGKH